MRVVTAVSCTSAVEAAHHLERHAAKPSGLHGNSYRLDAVGGVAVFTIRLRENARWRLDLTFPVGS